MRKLLLLITVCICSVLTGIASDEMYDYELNLGNFSKLRVVNAVNVIYQASTDSAGRAVFRAPKSMADFFIVSNNNGTLKVETLPYASDQTDLPTLYVYSEFLAEAKNESDSTLTIRSVMPCPRFKAVQVGNGRLIVDDIKATDVEGFLNTGNGTIVLNGQCTNAKFRMVGTGLIQADNLVSDNVECGLLGGGAIGCWPRFDMKVRGIGSTKIYYKGNPQINKKGGGKLYRLETYEPEDYTSRPAEE